jgi:hypothetical protein
MPSNNQSPLAGLFNFFKQPQSGSSSGKGRASGYPGLGGYSGNSGYYGYGKAPGSGGSSGFWGGSGGLPKPNGSSSGGNFGFGDLVNLFRNIDIAKVAEGINTFRTAIANAQKVAQTINQLGTIAGNIQKVMKNVDIEGLLSVLQGSNEESGTPNDSGATPGPTAPENAGVASASARKGRTASTKGKAGKRRTTRKSTAKRI